MVTLAIAAILVAVAAPAFTQTIRANRLSSQINEVVYALNMARSEAVKRGAPVTLCKSADRASCGGAWDNGWLIFVDRDRDGIIEASDADINGNGAMDTGEDINGSGALDTGDVLLKVAPAAVREGFSLQANNNFTNRVIYTPTGISTNRGTFVLCEGTNPAHARAVAVNSAGRVQLAADSNGNGKPEISNCAGTNDIDLSSCTPPFVPSC